MPKDGDTVECNAWCARLDIHQFIERASRRGLSKRLPAAGQTEKELVDRDALRRKLLLFENKPLTSTQIVALLTSVAESLPEGASGIQIEANRHEANTGFDLEIRLTKRFGVRGGTQQMWHTRSQVTLNQESLHDSNSSMSLDYATKSAAFSDFTEAIDKSLEASPNSSVSIRFSLIKDE